MSKKVYFLKGSDCAPCRQFEPVFNKVMEEFPDARVEVKIDDVAAMRVLGVRQVPSVVILNDSDNVAEILVGNKLTTKNLKNALS